MNSKQHVKIFETSLWLIAVWVSRQLGLKKAEWDVKTKSEHCGNIEVEISSKNSIELSIYWQDIQNGKVKSKMTVEKPWKGCYKGLGTVLEELKQIFLAEVAEIEHCKERIKQSKWNQYFCFWSEKSYLSS